MDRHMFSKDSKFAQVSFKKKIVDLSQKIKKLLIFNLRGGRVRTANILLFPI